MEKKDRKFEYFKGQISEILPKEYTDKKTNEKKKYWSVVLINQETNERCNGAIFDPSKFNKTEETIGELVNSVVQCSFYVDEQGQKHYFLFGPREPKKTFLGNDNIKANMYKIKVKKIDVFASKDTGNMFAKINIDPDSLLLYPKPEQIQTLVDTLGLTEEAAVKQLGKKIEQARPTFKDYDWSLIIQISSIAPNKNGKMVKPITMADGRIFDIIGNNVTTLANLVLKAHNEKSNVKYNKAETIKKIQAAINTKNLDALKEIVNECDQMEAFLNVKNGKLEGDKQRKFGKVQAFEPKQKI